MSAALRLGLVGAGPWGRNVLRALAGGRVSDALLGAVASRNPATAALAGAGCRVHADWRALLDERLDGVIVATPPATHLEIALAFLERGVAALIEKPLCLELEAALRFRDAARRAGTPVLVDHIHLFSPAYRLLKDLSPALGPIERIGSAGGRQGPVRADTPALWDWGPHDVAMVLDLMGAEPLAVAARRTLRRAAPPGVEENYAIELAFAGNVRAAIEIGNAMPPVRRLEVVHARGTLVYDDLAARKLAYVAGSGTIHPGAQAAIAASGPYRAPLECALEAFCAAIRTATRDPAPLELALGVVRVLEQAARAAD